MTLHHRWQYISITANECSWGESSRQALIARPSARGAWPPPAITRRGAGAACSGIKDEWTFNARFPHTLLPADRRLCVPDRASASALIPLPLTLQRVGLCLRRSAPLPHHRRASSSESAVGEITHYRLTKNDNNPTIRSCCC